MLMARDRRRWGDNDHYLGPFTFAFGERYRHFAVVLSSGDDEYPGCSLRISAFGNTMIAGLPAVIKPHTSWVDTSHYEWSKAGPDGRNGYTQVDETEYGFTISDGHLSVRLGRQTHDSSTTKDWGCFLPWTQWRFIRHSLYDLAGNHFWTEPTGKPVKLNNWRATLDAKEACPSASFEFDDFDGERIVAKTIIEEREWKFGTGSFKWLSFFRSPKIRRSLDIDFSKETGPRKGSWKGGTTGHSIDMLPGELHQSAFERYCLAHNMTFVGCLA